MEELDSKLFSSWYGLGAIAIVLGLLFACAAALIQSLTGGVFELSRAPVFLGVLATVVFLEPWLGFAFKWMKNLKVKVRLRAVP